MKSRLIQSIFHRSLTWERQCFTGTKAAFVGCTYGSQTISTIYQKYSCMLLVGVIIEYCLTIFHFPLLDVKKCTPFLHMGSQIHPWLSVFGRECDVYPLEWFCVTTRYRRINDCARNAWTKRSPHPLCWKSWPFGFCLNFVLLAHFHYQGAHVYHISTCPFKLLPLITWLSHVWSSCFHISLLLICSFFGSWVVYIFFLSCVIKLSHHWSQKTKRKEELQVL